MGFVVGPKLSTGTSSVMRRTLITDAAWTGGLGVCSPCVCFVFSFAWACGGLRLSAEARSLMRPVYQRAVDTWRPVYQRAVDTWVWWCLLCLYVCFVCGQAVHGRWWRLCGCCFVSAGCRDSAGFLASAVSGIDTRLSCYRWHAVQFAPRALVEHFCCSLRLLLLFLLLLQVPAAL
jgi:hypothetical protein